jgi:hypothetical protein
MTLKQKARSKTPKTPKEVWTPVAGYPASKGTAIHRVDKSNFGSWRCSCQAFRIKGQATCKHIVRAGQASETGVGQTNTASTNIVSNINKHELAIERRNALKVILEWLGSDGCLQEYLDISPSNGAELRDAWMTLKRVFDNNTPVQIP